MKFLGLLSLLWLNTALAAPGDYLYRDDPDASAVIEHTTKSDFEASSKPRLVEFYSPYCGGCRNFKPKYIELAKEIKAKYDDVEVYAVSCSPYKALCNKHKIQGYPSLFAFPADSTEGTYLQKSNMGGTYTVTAIADALKVASSKSSKTSSKAKKVLDDSDDVKKTSENNSSKTKKNEVSDNEKSSKKKKDDSEDKLSTKDKDDSDEKNESEDESAKKTSTMKKLIKDDDESEDKEKLKDKVDTAIQRSLNDEKGGDEDKDENIKEDDSKDEDLKEMEKDSKKEDSKDEEKEDSKDEEKEDSKDEENEDSKDEENEDSKDEENEDDKDEENEDDKEDENEDDKEDENEDDTDGKEDSVLKNSKEKEEESKEDDEDDEGDKDDKDDKDDEDDESKESDEDDEDDEDDSKDSKATPSLEMRTNAGRVANAAIGGLDLRLALKGYKSGAGAHLAKNKEKDMDRWKQVMEQRKKLAEQRKGKGFLRPSSVSTRFKAAGPGGKVKLSKAGTTGATKVMRANTPGTQEFEARKKEILAKILKAKGKKGFGFFGKKAETTTIVKKDQLPFQKDIRRPGLVRKTVEKLPVLKRFVKMSPEEELILDASLSFMTGLKHGIYMSNEELSSEKKVALRTWIELLSVSLPQEWGLHALIDDLLKNLSRVSLSSDNLQTVLSRHPMYRQRWSKSCDKVGGGGFSCGMWKLFHIVSLGVAEHHGGQNLVDSQMIDNNARTFSPAAAAEAIYEYMKNFFGCDDCRKHFVEMYDSCAFRRCDRLATEIHSATPDDWKQLPLWLWEVHNDVNIRVANKKVSTLKKNLASKHLQGAQSISVTPTDESAIRVLWPSLEDCLLCFDDTGAWNEDSVFEFLERSYWDEPDAKFDRLLTARKLEGEDPSGGGFVWIMMLVALCIVYSLRRHVHNLSFHKRIQIPTSLKGVGNKLGDAVGGKKRTS